MLYYYHTHSCPWGTNHAYPSHYWNHFVMSWIIITSPNCQQCYQKYYNPCYKVSTNCDTCFIDHGKLSEKIVFFFNINFRICEVHFWTKDPHGKFSLAWLAFYAVNLVRLLLLILIQCRVEPTFFLYHEEMCLYLFWTPLAYSTQVFFWSRWKHKILTGSGKCPKRVTTVRGKL